ncbi:hypothetical protein BH11PLA1_BH11PLA1_12650 [soil metagenome]
MSQFGMQMPGGVHSRGPVMNVYTGLMLAAVIALAAACIVMYMQGVKIAPGGDPMKVYSPDDAKNSLNFGAGS